MSDDHHFIERFTRAGYDLHFLVPSGKTGRDSPVEGLFVHSYPDFFRATERWPTFFRRIAWPSLFALIVTPRTILLSKRVKPHFILGHSHYSSFPCSAARSLLRVPTGVKLFGVMDLVHTEWSRAKYVFKNFEQIVAFKFPQDVWIILDDGTGGRDAALRHGVPARKIQFLPNGVNVEWSELHCDVGRVREEMGIPGAAVAVLFLARLVASKRPEAFLEAARLVLEKARRPVAFVIAGDGPDRAGCERLARRLGLGPALIFTGAVEHARVPALMGASDLFVSTSRLTNVAIPTCEAMVCGLPVVGFDVGTARDVIIDGETGFLVPDGNVDQLAASILRLVEDEALRREMGAQSRARARDIFTGWERRLAREEEIIAALTKDRATAPA